MEATDLPVNADFQSGYAKTPEGVAESVRLCVDAGVAGLSIEDATGRPDWPLYELPEALDRFVAAREATSEDVMLVARSECFLVGHPDPLNESIKRIRAYAEAGADVLFVPGIRERDQIRAGLEAAGPKPVNVLIGWPSDLTVQELAEMGVRRISVGSALARAAWGGLMRAAKGLIEGNFIGLESAASFVEIDALLGNQR